MASGYSPSGAKVITPCGNQTLGSGRQIQGLRMWMGSLTRPVGNSCKGQLVAVVEVRGRKFPPDVGENPGGQGRTGHAEQSRGFKGRGKGNIGGNSKKRQK